MYIDIGTTYTPDIRNQIECDVSISGLQDKRPLLQSKIFADQIYHAIVGIETQVDLRVQPIEIWQATSETVRCL